LLAVFTLLPATLPALQLICVGDKTVPCGATWSFDPPTATNGCTGTNVTITILGTVTNGSGCPVQATRTWQATDSCGSNATCSQTVTALSCVAPTNPVAWWPADGNASDIAGCHNGTFQNGLTFAPGEVAQAFSFDGTTNACLAIPHSPAFDLAYGHALDLWVKVGAYPPTGKYSILISKWANAAEEKSLTINSVGQVQYYLFTRFGGFGPVLVSSTTLALGTWYHVAATYDGATASIYISGVLDASQSVFGDVVRNSVGKLYFGYNPDLVVSGAPAVPFTGQADEIEWFNRALSTNEIAAIYNAGGAGQCKPSVLVVTCAADKTVPCGSNWEFDLPINIVSTCCAIYHTFSDATNSAACPLVLTRTWVFSDNCGNTNSCSQTVTVQPSSPTIQIVNGHAVISWCGGEGLEQANALDGPWQAVSTGISYTDPSPLREARFYRVVCPSALKAESR